MHQLLSFVWFLFLGCQPASLKTSLAHHDFDGKHAGEQRLVDSLNLVWCPSGSFIMGSPKTEPERRPGEDQVDVTFSHGFWMARYEITQKEWRKVIGVFPGE